MANKRQDLTFNLLGHDVSASRAFEQLSAKVEGMRAEIDRASAAVSAALDREQRAYRQTARGAEDAAAKQAAAAAASAAAAKKATGALGNVGDSAEDASVPFRKFLIPAIAGIAPAAIPMAAVAAGALATVGLGAQGALKQLSPLKDEFKDLQGEAAVDLSPGVQSIVRAARKAEPQIEGLVKVFGGAISDEVTALSDYLSNGGLQQFVSYAEKELPVVEDTFNNAAVAAVNLVKALAPAGDNLIKDIDAAAKAVSTLAKFVQEANSLPGKLQGAIPARLGGKNGVLGQITSQVEGFTLHPVTTGITDLGKAWDAVFGGGGHKKAAAVDTISQALSNMASDGSTASSVINNLNSALATLSGDQNAAAEAQLSFQDSLATIAGQVKANAQAYKDNGESLNKNTAEGRKNLEWLHQQIDSINNVANAQIKAKTPLSQVTTKLGQNEAALKKAATAAGLNAGQVQKLINKYAAVPAKVATQVFAKTAGANAALQTVISTIGRVPTSKTTHLFADTSAAVEAVSTFINTPTTKFVQVQAVGPAGAFGGRQSLTGEGHAAGGYLSEGWNTAGEGSATELMYKQGARVKVYTHPQSLALMGGAGTVVNNYNVVVEGSVASRRNLAREIASEVDTMRRRNGRPSILNS